MTAIERAFPGWLRVSSHLLHRCGDDVTRSLAADIALDAATALWEWTQRAGVCPSRIGMRAIRRATWSTRREAVRRRRHAPAGDAVLAVQSVDEPAAEMCELLAAIPQVVRDGCAIDPQGWADYRRRTRARRAATLILERHGVIS